MLSTTVYRQFCADLIKEVCEVFKPRYFHLGMDEENVFVMENGEILSLTAPLPEDMARLIPRLSF